MTGMSLIDLPYEIFAAIIQTALDGSTVPSNILCVCRLFCDVGTDHLYTHIKFTSVSQLHQFALSRAPHLPVVPHTMVVDLAGKAPRGVLRNLCGALVKCCRLANIAEGATVHDERDVRLKRLRLRMHSYSRDSVEALEQGLRAVSPDTFSWTGPDPDHHFSIAIVPLVAACLFKLFPAWCHIKEITVTNISFGTGTGLESPSPLMDDIPSLRTLYVGQATFLNPHAVVGMFCRERMAQLRDVKLVDAYSESIWGPRLRRSDIEKAAMILSRMDEQMAVIARVKSIVTCEKKTERIIGGDRVEGTHVLN